MWGNYYGDICLEGLIPKALDHPPDPSVENGAARHTHDTFFVQVASGNALVCGFGYALRIRAYGFGFGHLVCTFGKALRMQECAIVLGSCSFRESREKSREKRGSTVGPA